ncbi:unnamed protein product [Urochloa decumbens]|uniref:EGF-like domain-containing protein n=1 Tax=Urochloa decumbens TaxID=240449 RepID=A0ABC8XD47_9POAL
MVVPSLIITSKMGLLGRSPAVTADEPMRLLLLALLACCACAAGASICDTASCGKGNCTVLSGLVPGLPYYECHCDPGWSHASKAFPFSPCTVPNCPFHGDCFNLSLQPPIGIPKDVCATVSCGAGGACKTGDLPFSYSCECQPGYANLLNLTTLPCANNCERFLRQGLLRPGARSDASARAGAGVTLYVAGADRGRRLRTSVPPSGTKGSVRPRRLQQLLLLVTLAMAQVM